MEQGVSYRVSESAEGGQRRNGVGEEGSQGRPGPANRALSERRERLRACVRVTVGDGTCISRACKHPRTRK
jgi:hypothetical protein